MHADGDVARGNQIGPSQRAHPRHHGVDARAVPERHVHAEGPAPIDIGREILARSRGLWIFRGEGTRRDDLDPRSARELARSLPRPTFRTKGPWLDLDAIEQDPRSA